MKEQVLDDEGINTLMCEVESIVNGGQSLNYQTTHETWSL